MLLYTNITKSISLYIIGSCYFRTDCKWYQHFKNTSLSFW